MCECTHTHGAIESPDGHSIPLYIMSNSHHRESRQPQFSKADHQISVGCSMAIRVRTHLFRRHKHDLQTHFVHTHTPNHAVKHALEK